MKRQTAIFVLATLTSLMLSTCSIQNVKIVKCIPPSTDFAYKASSSGIKPYPAEDVLPSAPWTEEGEIPRAVELLAVRTIGPSAQEIWASAMSTNANSGYDQELIVYRTDTRELKTISLEQGLDDFRPVLFLYISADNSVWAFHDAGFAQANVPILSKYDETSSSLKFAQGTENIPNGTLENGQIRYSDQILLDKDNIFWIFVPDNFVYSFNPDTGQVKQHSSLSGIFPLYHTLAPDGSIYILDKGSTEGQIFHFFPKSDKLQRVYYGLEPWPPIPSLLADHSEKLWAGGLGWMESDGTWYQIVRSPLFITTRLDLDGGRVYRWQQPQILLESSNNLLWFTAPNGMFSLDPEKGQWCWFTTYLSNIVEDQQHNLWMIADNKLFKYSIDNK